MLTQNNTQHLLFKGLFLTNDRHAFLAADHG